MIMKGRKPLQLCSDRRTLGRGGEVAAGVVDAAHHRGPEAGVRAQQPRLHAIQQQPQQVRHRHPDLSMPRARLQGLHHTAGPREIQQQSSGAEAAPFGLC